jgi:hypothetical protein
VRRPRFQAERAEYPTSPGEILAAFLQGAGKEIGRDCEQSDWRSELLVKRQFDVLEFSNSYNAIHNSARSPSSCQAAQGRGGD